MNEQIAHQGYKLFINENAMWDWVSPDGARAPRCFGTLFSAREAINVTVAKAKAEAKRKRKAEKRIRDARR